MGRCRIVTPESVRLPLSDGDFLTVKKELNAGEYHALVTEGAAGKPFAVVIAYLVGWSLVGLGDSGKKNDPGTRARMRTDLALCKIMGLSYDDIQTLPRVVYEVLVEDLAAHAAKDEVPV